MIRIGTSGWSYRHWKGAFYPEGLNQKRWLQYYSERFDTVELNASFYRIPAASVARGWAERTPAGFRFAVKVSRLITHVRRLTECEDTLKWFFTAFEPLQGKIAAYLLQLPPSFVPTAERLDAFFSLLPAGSRYVVELRNREAYSGVIPELLGRRGITFCIHDLSGRETPLLATAPLVYLRFHGTSGRYAGSYPDSALELWAERIGAWAAEGRDVLAYFNNDIGGHAVRNAASLRSLLGLVDGSGDQAR